MDRRQRHNDHQVLKFRKAGKFVMQIGKAGQSKGNADTRNLNQPADTFVYTKTNELFVADGYGNRRVIVFDAHDRRVQADVGRVRQRPDRQGRRTSRRRTPTRGRAAVRAAGARCARVERRPRLRLRSRRQARAGVHHRRESTS